MSTLIRQWYDFVLQQFATESYLPENLQDQDLVIAALKRGNNNPTNPLNADPDAPILSGQTRLTDSGFSATLIQKKDENGNLTNEYTLSIRSTEYRDHSEVAIGYATVAGAPIAIFQTMVSPLRSSIRTTPMTMGAVRPPSRSTPYI